MKQKTVTVDGVDYFISQMPTTRGIKCMKALLKLIGPSLAELAGSVDKEKALSNALGSLLENMDGVDVETLFKELVSTASKDSMAINFDLEFAGEYGRLLGLLQEIVVFNFGSVFTQVGSLTTAQ